MVGKYWMQVVTSADIATWTSDDQGRLVYNETDDNVYYADSSAWINMTDTPVHIHREEFVSTAGQTVFTSSFAYELSTNELTVYSNNVLMIEGVDYNETAVNQVTFLVGRNLSEPVTLISTDSDTSVFRSEQIAAAAQTAFVVPWNYVVGSDNLLVFSNSFLMINGVDYNETDNTTITFTSPRSLGEKVSLIYYDNGDQAGSGGVITDAANLGSASDGSIVYSYKTGGILYFKRIKGSSALNVTSETNDVLIELLPANVLHNSLGTLQGGSTSERFHLTLAQYNSVVGMFGWSYDSGWVADWGPTNDQVFNHGLGLTVFGSIIVQMRDGNNIPVQFNGSAISENRAPGEYNRGYGPRITMTDSNNITVDCPIYSGSARWMPDHSDSPPGWAGNQPTELRILIRK